MKFLHTLGACGLSGALLSYAIVLIAPNSNWSDEVRRIVDLLCNYVMFPSLALVLITGLLAMVVHRPFQDMRWVWLKAFLGLSVFEASLGFLSKAGQDAGSRATVWSSLIAIMLLCIANIVLAIWRPRLSRP